MKRLWIYISVRRRMQLGLLFVLILLASLVDVISIGAVIPFLGVFIEPERIFEHELMQPMIQFFQFTEPKQLLLPLTIAFSIAALMSGAIRLLLVWGQARLSHAIGADLSFEIYRRTLYQPYSVHAMRNSSEVISAIATKVNHVVGQIILPTLLVSSSSMMLVMIMFTLIMINPRVALGAFTGFSVIYLLVALITKKRLLTNSQCISRGANQVVKALQEGLGGIRDILIDGTQSTYCNIFRKADLPMRRAMASNQIIGKSPRYGVESLGIVLIAVLTYGIAGGTEDGGIASAIPIIGAFALGAQRMMPELQQAYLGWSNIRGGEATMRDALELLEQPLPAYIDMSLADLVFERAIALRTLSFRYTDNTQWVLSDLNLEIKKGSRIGFIGSTGSGKSTLLDIIMGLLSPSEGTLQIDDEVITLKNQRAWQAHIAHVPQAIFLGDATIAENIAFGVPVGQIDHERVRHAAQQAQIASTIESWAKQYDTQVGEHGVRLSGGQRQRIGIARALYKQAKVLVFDEATSALDNETENAVMEAISEMGKEITILIVAHRLTTLSDCDQVVELANGRVKRIGTYAEIIGS